MTVSQAPAAVDRPLSIGIQGAQEPTGAGGVLHVGQLPADPASGAERFVAMMATSFQAPPESQHERLAVEALLAALESSQASLPADQLRIGFREANRSIHGELGRSPSVDSAGVGMLALLTHGKYASLALVGQDRAYLCRAGRLTQLTRDQRIDRARSRRKESSADQTAAGQPQVRLLGESDRLDSRSPAVFEITLLPEDRLALLSHALVERLGEKRILAGLEPGGEGIASLVASVEGPPQGSLMTAVLEVAPSRELAPPPVLQAAPSRPLWLFILPLLIAIVAIALLALFIL
jgi:hypothetical protein